MEYSKKMLIVIAPENFRDEELFEPLAILEENGIEYEIISTEKGRFQGMLGGYATATETITETLQLLDGGRGMKHYGGLMIIGGSGSKDYLWGDEELYGIVRHFNEAIKPTGAICLSPVVLARAGVIAGRHATVWPDREAIRELEKHKALYEDTPVVNDGNFITAKGPEAAAEFGRRMAEAFLGTVL
ncbi:MAG: DJ-1/PfpI family protein [Methanomicrobiaceae archaeon]|nr:DJ-1/PfpI family protein [Methanomicrobiaceae archaeon]